MEEEENPEERYFSALKQLIDLMKEIFSKDAPKNAKAKTPFEKKVDLYEKTFAANMKNRSFSHHTAVFISMYEEYSDEFLEIDEEDNFIRDLDKKIEPVFGKGTPLEKKGICLPITTACYKAARMYETCSNQLTGDNDKDQKIYDSPEYTLYDEMKYYLIFNICNSFEYTGTHKRDRKILLSMLDEMKPTTVNERNEIKGSTIQSMIESAKEKLKETTKTMPEEQAKKMTDMIDGISSKFTQDKMEGYVEKIGKGEKDFGSVFKGIIQEVEPDIREKMVFSGEDTPEGVEERKQFNETMSIINNTTDDIDKMMKK